MSDDLTQYLETFPAWLRSLGEDAETLGGLITETGMAADAREAVIGGVNYLFKSLDLIPDGTDDIGLLDDAFVLRVAADLAMQEELGDISTEAMQFLGRLTNEAELVRSFLGDDYSRLESYVKSQRKGAARGRSVADILEDEDTQKEFVDDVAQFHRTYEAPSFNRDEKNLIKLKAFFDAKLPA